MASPLHLFKRKLTNLSSANPHLWMPRPRPDFHLDLKDWELAEGKKTFEFLDEIFSGKKKLKLASRFDTRDGFSNLFSQKINRLFKQKKLISEERGVDELNLAYPFIQGLWPDGSPLRMPFLLFPTRLEAGTHNWEIRPETSEAFINPGFLLAYAHHTQTALFTELYDKEIDLEASDTRSFLTAFYHKIQESGLQIHFNQDLFSGEIEAFGPIQKHEHFLNWPAGLLKLAPHAVLGLFSQSDSVLIPDFEYLEKSKTSLEAIFLKSEIGSEAILEKHLLCPLPMDGSQEDCIRKVKSGQSLVIQGPPGTGKSQVITNLMADAIGSGKTVALVCQKKVALEVVFNRLEKLGLSAQVAMWSDYKKDRDSLFQKLAKSIENLEDTEARNQHLDTVILERNFLKICQSIEEITQKLEKWKQALFDKDLAGISIRELYLAEKEQTASHFYSHHFLAFPWENWQWFTSWFLRYRFDFQKSLEKNSFLAKRKNWFVFGNKAPSFFSSLAEDWKQNCQEVEAFLKQKETFQGNFESLPFQEMEAFLQKTEGLELTRLPKFFNDFEAFAKKEISLPDFLKKLEACQLATEKLLNWPKNLWVEKDEIPLLLEIFRENKWSLELKAPHFLKWLLFPKCRPYYKKLRSLGNPEISPVVFSELLSLAQAWFQIYEDLREYGFENPDKDSETIKILRLHLDVILEYQSTIANSLQLFPLLQMIQNQAFDWKKYLKPEVFTSFSTFRKTLETLQNCHLKSFKTKEKWATNFTEWNESAFRLAIEKPGIWTEEISQKMEAILQTDRQFLEQGPEFEALVREIILENPKANTAENWSLFLESAWRISWIKFLENRSPILQETSKPSWKEELHFLQNLIEEKNRITASILKLRLEEKSYKNLEYNRLNNRTSYRELYHQVSKKRQKKPLRNLWQNHEEELKKLLPAWLTTPESMSATWPMDTQFDLVIFDEASQCLAEKGIPAAFRGKTIVVVGDAKQLQPNTHFLARWTDEEATDNAISGQESLLDLACQFLPQQLLRGHYRSLYPELIAFSNQYFYQNKLEFFPHAQALFQRSPSIFWHKVAGLWKNQCNECEAREIAENVFQFSEKFPGESLGIITFNARQQELIEQWVESLSFEKKLAPPVQFFIKNIENVQGDECDHLWFSVAYAPNEQGKMIYQFGSLSQSGGENRLNVAITRARKSIHLFCSFVPAQFEPGENTPSGPVLLKKFLQYAWTIQDQNQENGMDFKWENSNWWQELQKESGQDLEKRPPKIWQNDGALLYQNASLKDYYGYKPLIFKEKGYMVDYRFSRPESKRE